MVPPPRLLVFDLDGTLIDSRIDLTNSVNAMLSHLGQPTLAEPTIASYIGDGAAALVRRAVEHAHLISGRTAATARQDDAFLQQALEWFIRYYHQHMLDYTYVYPGVMESLSAIRERHPRLAMAVLTNKPVNPSRAICKHFSLDRFFFANYGGNTFSTKKPAPEGLLKLMAEAHAAPAETVMIGDSHVDVETARACATRSLGCSFGLSPHSLANARPDATVDHASAWPAALQL